MKKLVALFGAVSCLLACLPVQTFAAGEVDPDSWKEYLSESGCPYTLAGKGASAYFKQRGWACNNEFLVVTSGEGLPENVENYFDKNVTYKSVKEWDDYAETCTENVYFMDGSLQQTYGEDSRFYIVQVGSSDNPYTACRKFSSYFDSVRDTYILKNQMQGQCYWDGTFDISINQNYSRKLADEEISIEDLQQAYPEVFGENNALEQFKQKYDGWTEKMTAWREENPDISMTSAEALNSLTLAGMNTPDSVTSSAAETAEQFYEDHKDVIGSCSANLIKYDEVRVYDAYSPYEDIGDVNEDGELNALDAQAILQFSARSAVSGDTSFTKEQENFADLNADGFVNAEDASLVLQYSAEKGAGSSESLEEFLTR